MIKSLYLLAFVVVAMALPTVWALSTCPDGSTPVRCILNPCDFSNCSLGCRADYCGGCNARCQCQVDSDCPAGGLREFCRPTRLPALSECRPYAREGQPCGGFVPDWAESRCAPNFSCVAVPSRFSDFPGVCLKSCAANKDCPSVDFYCTSNSTGGASFSSSLSSSSAADSTGSSSTATASTEGVCVRQSRCLHWSDCMNSANHWKAPPCPSSSASASTNTTYCSEEGTCQVHCGDFVCSSWSDCPPDFFCSSGGSCVPIPMDFDLKSQPGKEGGEVDVKFRPSGGKIYLA